MYDVLLIPVREASLPALLLVFSCRVPAGFPSPAPDELEGLFDLNRLLFRHPDATYLVRVSGGEHERGRIWEPGAVYVKAGVVMAGLEAQGGQQLGLFGEAAPLAAGAAVSGQSAQMMTALDGLNARVGRGTVHLAAALGPKGGGPVPW